uniref:Uncharacterized protein n=1 Tax=Anguilla anguilla TaxID=7936 RepID=A0A0E9VIP2_ANGAN
MAFGRFGEHSIYLGCFFCPRSRCIAKLNLATDK